MSPGPVVPRDSLTPGEAPNGSAPPTSVGGAFVVGGAYFSGTPYFTEVVRYAGGLSEAKQAGKHHLRQLVRVAGFARFNAGGFKRPGAKELPPRFSHAPVSEVAMSKRL